MGDAKDARLERLRASDEARVTRDVGAFDAGRGWRARATAATRALDDEATKGARDDGRESEGER